MSATPWVIGGLALLGGGAIIYIATRPAKAQTPALPAATSLVPGKRYTFVAVRAPGVDPLQTANALQAIGWKSAQVWFFGQNAPADVVWPPVADKTVLYAAHATWNGPATPVPAGIMGLRELPATGGAMPVDMSPLPGGIHA